ncbi:MAG: 4'-phosphopantetheinyl transferase superfamily protein, partial [Desulfovibrionaceae bacterium]|nr:4'-phosphopantetheinyl transferase superfamily protein [Desulfovibrionaceae bacterium]
MLSGEISLQQASALYGAEDAEYLSRYTSMEALSLRLQARRLLLYGLQELGLTQRPVHILKTKHGRPYLTLPDIAVSFSYTDRALCLLGTREKTKDEQAEELCIGADWEEKRTSQLPPASFLAADQAWTEGVDEKEDNTTRILKRWCRTEAVLKAAGCGIRIHPRSIEWTEHDKGRHAGTAIIHAQKQKGLYTWQDV